MKKSEYEYGEFRDYKSIKNKDHQLTDVGAGFANLFPQSSSIIYVDKIWISYDTEDIGCRVRKKFAIELQCVCKNYLNTFYSEKDVGITVLNLIAVDSKIQRNQRTSLRLAGADKPEELTKKLSRVTEFVCSRVQQIQPDLFFRDEPTGLLPPEVVFLTDQIVGIRKRMSDMKITHPFGIETLDSSMPPIGFSGEFDKYEFDPAPAEKVSGLATVDGFREFRNTVYLTILDSAKILEASKDFVIQDTTLFKKIIEAKHFSKKVRYFADKVFEKRPDKPTFILKKIEILD